jgi:hypothetical protein
MNIITEISSNEKLLIEAVKTLSPDQQREAMNFINFLQLQGQKTNENEPELVTDNSTVRINIYQILGESHLTFERQGQQIYPLIAEGLKRDKIVVVSFQNIERITWPFIKKAIGQLYDHFPESQIKSSLKMSEITPDQVKLVNEFLETKKQYQQDPEKFKQPMSEERLAELRKQNPDNPIFELAGIFVNDETFDDMLTYIAEYRQERDAEYFRELDETESQN